MRLCKFIRAVLGAVAMFAIVGCGGTGADPDTGGNTALEQADLNLINAAPDCPAADIYLNGKLTATVDYRKATGFVKVKAGRIKVDVRLKGDVETSLPLLSEDVNVDVNARLSLALLGRIKADINVDADAKLKLVALTAGTVDAAAVKLRVLHASPSAPKLDVAVDAKLVASTVAYAQVSAYAALGADLAVGAKLGLRLDGASIDAAIAATVGVHAKGSVLTAIPLGEILPTCADDRFLAISILNELTGELIDLNLQINLNGPKASLYLFHGSADLGTVDLAVKGGAVLHANLGYLKASPILQVSAGILDVELRAAASLNALLSARLKLLPGTHWTLCATGLLNAGVNVQAKLNLAAAARLTANIGAHARIWNAVVDVPAINVYAGVDAWAKALAFAKAGLYVKLTGGLQVLDLNVKAAADLRALLTAAITQSVVSVCKDQVVTYFVVGALDANLNAQLKVVAVIESDLTTNPLVTISL